MAITESLTNPLLICTWFLKNQVEKFKFDELDFLVCKNHFRNWFLQAKQAVKFQFKINQKSSLLNLIFPNWSFRNQVQINRGIGNYQIPHVGKNKFNWLQRNHKCERVNSLHINHSIFGYLFDLRCYNKQAFTFWVHQTHLVIWNAPHDTMVEIYVYVTG